MPELPDVEAYKRYLDKYALGQKLEHVEVQDAGILKTSASKLRDSLKGNKLEESKRVGKYLLIKAGDYWVVMHFGMTGYLNYFKVNGGPPKFSKILFYFDNDHILSYINKRKFGYVDLIKNIEEYLADKKVGPDALEVDLTLFRKILNKKKSKIKSVFMDQKPMSGVGNIYADEILYQARIHPEAPTAKLSDEQVKELYNKMKQVLETAIKHNAQPEDLPSHFLIHSREDGEQCPGCDGKVKKITVGGRSTYFCPECQKQ